jgi:hypothetical protein
MNYWWTIPVPQWDRKIGHLHTSYRRVVPGPIVGREDGAIFE